MNYIFCSDTNSCIKQNIIQTHYIIQTQINTSFMVASLAESTPPTSPAAAMILSELSNKVLQTEALKHVELEKKETNESVHINFVIDSVNNDKFVIL